MALGCLLMFDWALQEHTQVYGKSQEAAESAARSMVFMTMAFFQLFNALAIRSERQSIFVLSPSTNRYLYGAVGIAGFLQVAVIYFPPLQEIFKTSAVTGVELFVSLAVASSILFAVEIEKALLYLWSRKKNRSREMILPVGVKSPIRSE